MMDCVLTQLESSTLFGRRDHYTMYQWNKVYDSNNLKDQIYNYENFIISNQD